jgi:hypothetical protein
MRVTIDIPDRYVKRNLYVFAGLEPVARSRVHRGVRGLWEVKTAGCRQCGKCCAAIREDHPLGSPTGCIHLDGHMCGLGIFRPHGCAIADGWQVGVEDCSVKWEQAE